MDDSDTVDVPRPSWAAVLSEVRAEKTLLASEYFLTDTVPVFATVSPLGGSENLPPHAHDFIEIVVVAEGRGRHITAHGSVALTPGTVVVVRPGAWHSFHRARDVVAALIGISHTSLGSDLAFLRARAPMRDLLYAGPVGTAAKGVWMTEVAGPIVDDVIAESRRLAEVIEARPGDTLVILGCLISVLGRLAAGLPDSHDRREFHPSVATALDLLESEVERAWSVAELAAEVRLDAAYLSRLFRTAIGVPPIAYLARLRAERAAALLAGSDLPVNEVGAEVGWPDPAYFSRRFHALIGLSPSRYRRQMRADLPLP